MSIQVAFHKRDQLSPRRQQVELAVVTVKKVANEPLASKRSAAISNFTIFKAVDRAVIVLFNVVSFVREE